MGNGNFCDCGRHQGIGLYPDNTPLTPADTVARYKRLREKIPMAFTPAMADYIADYERQHGPVTPITVRMEVGKKKLPVMVVRAKAQTQGVMQWGEA